MEYIKKISSIDLNLLTVFHALAETLHVTKAAKKVGLSQPAMSHSLARLRKMFDDPLFVKVPKGVVPTPRAEQLAPVVADLLQRVNQQLFSGEDFSPAALERTFRIRTSDYIEALFMPKLIATLRRIAPKVQVSVTALEFSLPKEDLEQGRFDLAIAGFFGAMPDGFYQQKVFEDEFACAIAKNHPRLSRAKTLSLDTFCNEDHLLIAPGGSLQGAVDDLLKRKKKTRHVTAGCSSYLVSGLLLEASDLVLTAPKALLQRLVGLLPLRVFDPPFTLPRLSMLQVWHERNHSDEAHKWFRTLVHQILSEV